LIKTQVFVPKGAAVITCTTASRPPHSTVSTNNETQIRHKTQTGLLHRTKTGPKGIVSVTVAKKSSSCAIDFDGVYAMTDDDCINLASMFRTKRFDF